MAPQSNRPAARRPVQGQGQAREDLKVKMINNAKDPTHIDQRVICWQYRRIVVVVVFVIYSEFSPSPLNPSLQAQLNPPSELVQSALTSQLSIPVEHSSTSEQSTPSPLNPALQEHSKAPNVFEQDPLDEQLSDALAHSSISEQLMCIQFQNRGERLQVK